MKSKRPHDKLFRRKLATPAHRRLMLTPDGTLAMKDGSDPTSYLKKWRRNQGMKGPVFVSVITVEQLEHLESDALLARNWAS